MPTPLLVVVSGAPGTGKTTLALRLANDLSLPLINKDGIKEALFDSLGWSDRAWSRRLGVASIHLMFWFAENLLRAGQSLAMESNFDASYDLPRFDRLLHQYAFTLVQVHCFADPACRAARMQQRWASGNRHPGHVEHLTEPVDIERLASRAFDALDLGGSLISLDTTDFDALDYDHILATIRAAHATNG